MSVLWRLRIDMRDETKRPRMPSIEVVTRPGEKVGKYQTQAQVDVILRSCSTFCYGILGIQLPEGIERRDMTCRWDENKQSCVLEAKLGSANSGESDGGLVTGMEARFAGFTQNCFKSSGSLQTYTVMYDSNKSSFAAGTAKNALAAVLDDDPELEWEFNNLDVKSIALQFQYVPLEDEEEPPAKPREYGDQCWIHNPVVKLSHLDGEPFRDILYVPNPYAMSPFEENAQDK
ncbi:hypothetical protein DdX_02804 [Ditylenchus destructor]|uniref:Uncharacterized protein n=1 Tax=Ditylenchus destructor TaxID=166010 RepID=A0AAD4RC92_9BILA|nr:hypothetical protein DdX_02804 [Ditylenchus destructor]